MKVPSEVLDHLKLREGVRTKVYKDSLGKPTVGVGHLVLPEDNLKVGDVISDELVNQFLAHDSLKAYKAAIEQAEEVGLGKNKAFINALTSVNFQLGTGWTKKFPNTWLLIDRGKYAEAAEAIKDSKWYFQTPTRVRDFEKALLALVR